MRNVDSSELRVDVTLKPLEIHKTEHFHFLDAVYRI